MVFSDHVYSAIYRTHYHIKEVRCLLIIFIRTVIIYIVVLFIITIMGKSELSKMSPFQMVIIFMIAELASIPIESPDVSMINGVTAIFTLLFLQVLISFLSIKSERFKRFVSGKPSILIEKGKINEKELKSLRITINDLMEQLRLANSPSISDVDYAVMETNGDLSVIPKQHKKPVTTGDMHLPVTDTLIPLILISAGYLYMSNIKAAGFDENQLRSQLLSVGITDYKDVLVAFSDENRKIHIYKKNPKGKSEEVTK